MKAASPYRRLPLLALFLTLAAPLGAQPVVKWRLVEDLPIGGGAMVPG